MPHNDSLDVEIVSDEVSGLRCLKDRDRVDSLCQRDLIFSDLFKDIVR
jgi:hypothetical protein